MRWGIPERLPRPTSPSPSLTRRVPSLSPLKGGEGVRRNVRQSADRQSGRDCAAHSSRVPRDGDQDGRGAFDRRRQCDECAARRRDRVHRPAAGARQLSECRGDPLGRDDHRRRCDPSRSRLSRRGCRFRRDGGGARLHLHRPLRRAHPADGQQGRGEKGGAQARDPDGSRFGRRRARRRGGGGGGPRDRLSGADQGQRGRRRARHEGGAERRRAGPFCCRLRSTRRHRSSAAARSISNAISSGPGISRSRFSGMARAASSISASATARCSARTRSCSRRPLPRR